jgi:nitrous oxidase accessory protein
MFWSNFLDQNLFLCYKHWLFWVKKMREKQTSLTLFLILCFAVVSIVEIGPVKAESNTLVVPDDYSFIQEAINNASEGDTIFVKNGIYYELFLVNKSICLVGENRDATVIDGSEDFGNVIEVVGTNITIANLTIQKASGNPIYYMHGINIDRDSTNIVISNNTIKDNFGFGIYHEGLITDFSNITIVGNNITDNTITAIAISCGDNNTISHNRIENHGFGISLSDSSNNVVAENSITDISNYGIDIDYGTNNLIFRNNITATKSGISQSGSNNTISENNITNSENGISLHSAHDNTITGNNVSDNQSGFSLAASTHNVIHENLIKDNDVGVVLWMTSSTPSMHNQFFRNNFVNNSLHVSFPGSETGGNSWFFGSEGNYWSDYNGVDSNCDGIGDTPYVIDENNSDNYPLIEVVIVPESPAWIILPTFVALTVAVKIYRKKQKKRNPAVDSLP